MIKKILLVLTTFYCGLLFSQEAPFCRVTNANQTILKLHPESKVDYLKLNTKSINTVVNTNAAAAYTIPVVFHVYGTTHSGQSVTSAKIKTALEKLNEDFKGLNADYNSVDPLFIGIRSSLDIEFKLATINPQGKCTNGIVFYNTKSGYASASGYDAAIQQDAWDNYKYLNVYLQNDLFDDGNLTASGVAWYPNTWMSDNNLSRVVYNGGYIYGNTNDEFASVLTHEFGHWLNLIHVFEEGCSGTDNVTDTPQEDGTHSDGCTIGATNCSGTKINYENYMGYNGGTGCYKMFSQGQVSRMLTALTHSTRQPLWQESNLLATGVSNISSINTLTSSIGYFKETIANTGAFNASATIILEGTTFTSNSGNLTNGVDYTVNIPNGLLASITIQNNTEALISITGTATNHAVSNNALGTITFLNTAITGGTASLNCTAIDWNFKFYDPFGVYYVDIDDKTVNMSTTWQEFEIEADADNKSFGLFVDNGDLKLETYKKALIADNISDRNISFLWLNEAVNNTRNFVDGGVYPNLHNLRSNSYTTWDNLTGYIGFKYYIDNQPCYGWFKVIVSADGKSYTLTQYAYNTEPNAAIYTPTTLGIDTAVTSDEIIDFKIYPNPFKDSFKINRTNNFRNSKLKVELYSIIGKKVLTKYIEFNSNTIVVDNLKLSKGVYIIKITSGDNTVLTKQLIKQ